MSKSNQHVIPLGNGWAVKKEGSSRLLSLQKPKKMLLLLQDTQNNKSELIIHGKDGEIQDKNSYGNDPNPPKDKKL